MKLSLLVCAFALCYLVSVVQADDDDVMAEWTSEQNMAAANTDLLPSLVRNERAAKNKPENKNKKNKGDVCKYTKETWSECDPKTNMRTRTLTLKKGDAAACEPTKTIQKKCKKGKQNCQYNKGAWSACTPQNQMTRTDRVKPGSDPSCEASRQVTRPCKNKQAANKQTKGGSGGSGRKNKQ